MTTITINGQPVEATRIDELNQTLLQTRDHVVPAMHDGQTVRLSVAQILGLLLREDLAEKLLAEDMAYDPGTSGPLSAETVQAALDDIASSYISSRQQLLSEVGQSQARANISAASPFRAVISGSANAISLTDAAPITAGLKVRFRAIAMNTGPATIAYNGGSPIACRTITGVALPDGYIRTGVDTEAIFDGTYWVLDRQEERGSNANGEYVRFADGTQICAARGIAGGSNSAAGDIYRTESIPWVYPAAFAGVPTGSAAGSNTDGVWGGGLVGSNTSGTFRIFAHLSLSSAQGQVLAIGRWF